MSVDVRHAREIQATGIPPDTSDLAVVIDVVRAFTVAPWVLRQGAEHLLLSPDAEAALRARADHFPDAVLLKDGQPDPRFALPNAPGAIAELDLSGRTVIQTTGNGTRGAHLVRDVPLVACASFATASATASLVRQFERVLLVPTEGDEDDALADYLRCRVRDERPDLDALLARVRKSPAGVECLTRGADPSFPGVHPRDLDLCQAVDEFDHALVLEPQGDLLAVTLH